MKVKAVGDFLVEIGRLKPRNPYAVAAHLRGGAGAHKDRRKKREKDREQRELRREIEEARS